jgi:hypothetical protein
LRASFLFATAAFGFRYARLWAGFAGKSGKKTLKKKQQQQKKKRPVFFGKKNGKKKKKKAKTKSGTWRATTENEKNIEWGKDPFVDPRTLHPFFFFFFFFFFFSRARRGKVGFDFALFARFLTKNKKNKQTHKKLSCGDRRSEQHAQQKYAAGKSWF